MNKWSKYYQRWSALLLCLVMVISLASCSDSDESEGGSGEFDPQSYNVSLTMPGEGGVAFLGEESMEVRLEINNTGTYRASEGTAKFTYTSVYGGDPQSTTKTFKETSGETNTVITIPTKTVSMGYWSVDVEIGIDGNTLETVSKGYCVVNKPQNYGTANDNAFFGVMGTYNNASAAQRIGAGIDRPSVYWRFTRQADGTLNWNELDKVLKHSTDNNLNVILLIQPEVLLQDVSLPGMEITSAEDLIRADVLEEYKVFLRETVRRYKDKVYAFEVINDPDINFMLHGNLSPEKTGEIVAAVMALSYEIIKEEAPEKMVLGVSVSEREYFNTANKKKTITEYIFDAAKGAKLADAFSIHPYPTKWMVSETADYTTPEDFGLHRIIGQGLNYMKTKGFSKAYVTETGYGVSPSEPLLSQSRKMQAALAVRSMIICKSFSEVEAAVYFSLCYDSTAGNEANMALFGPGINTGNYFPYVGAAAYAQVAYALYDTTPAKTISTGENDTISAYQFNSSEQTVIAVWKNRSSQQITIDGISSLNAFDTYGNSLGAGDISISVGDSPIYLIVGASEGNSLAQAVEALVSQ